MFGRENLINYLVNIGGSEALKVLGKKNVEIVFGVHVNLLLGVMAVCWLWQFLFLEVDEFEMGNTKKINKDIYIKVPKKNDNN